MTRIFVILITLGLVAAEALAAFGQSAERHARRETVSSSRAEQSEEEGDKLSWDDQFVAERSKELRAEYNEFLQNIGVKTKTRVKVSERFLFVYDVSDGYIEWLSALLEEVGKAFDKFTERLGLEVKPLDEPMVVVVFATREEFNAYAIKIQGPNSGAESGNLTGFYSQWLNRSIVYDRTGGEATRSDYYKSASRGQNYTRKQINEEAREIKKRVNADSNTSTIVHEATHQLCYNHGIFSRRFHAPDWVVEGMAMTFEQTTPNAPLGWRYRSVFPVNYPRLNELRQYAKSNPKCEIFDEILVSDAFEKRLDNAGYAASWAMFYYCYRKRPEELAKYLKIIAEKEPRSRYTKEDRVADFVECFGPIGDFGSDLVRFMRGL